jgi:hypothetical protein
MRFACLGAKLEAVDHKRGGGWQAVLLGEDLGGKQARVSMITSGYKLCVMVQAATETNHKLAKQCNATQPQANRLTQ